MNVFNFSNKSQTKDDITLIENVRVLCNISDAISRTVDSYGTISTILNVIEMEPIDDAMVRHVDTSLESIAPAFKKKDTELAKKQLEVGLIKISDAVLPELEELSATFLKFTRSTSPAITDKINTLHSKIKSIPEESLVASIDKSEITISTFDDIANVATYIANVYNTIVGYSYHPESTIANLESLYCVDKVELTLNKSNISKYIENTLLLSGLDISGNMQNIAASIKQLVMDVAANKKSNNIAAAHAINKCILALVQQYSIFNNVVNSSINCMDSILK